MWPTSVNDGKAYLHYGTTCPNYKKGTPSGFASVADYDGQDKCSKCHFGVLSLGAVAAPSTSIENGFEYHFDEFFADLQAVALVLEKRLATWDLRPFTGESDFLVAVASRPADPPAV